MPTIDPQQWQVGNHKNIFKKWIIAFQLMIHTIKLDKKPYEWVLSYKQLERQAASSYPGIATSARKQQHRDAQASLLYFLHRICLDFLPDIIKAHPLQKYHDVNLEINGEPCCIGTLCLEAIDKYCAPQDEKTLDFLRSRFTAKMMTFSGLSSHSDAALHDFKAKLATTLTEWLELSEDQVYKVQEQALIRQSKGAINAYMLTATQIQKQMQWNKFLESLNIDLAFQAAPTIALYIDLLSKHATAAYQNLSLAGLTQGPSIDKATTAQVTFVATQDEKRIECKYCGGVHEIEVCRKLQAAQAKRNINVLHARDDELPPPSTSKKSSINSKRFQGKARANP